MRIEVKTYNDEGVLTNTITARGKAVVVEENYEEPERAWLGYPHKTSPRLESLRIELKDPTPTRGGVLYTSRNEIVAPSWEPTGWYRIVNTDGSYGLESKDVETLHHVLVEGETIERGWKRIEETEWRPA